jgi:hypothetical protein
MEDNSFGAVIEIYKATFALASEQSHEVYECLMPLDIVAVYGAN